MMLLRVVWIEAVMTLLNEGTIFCVTGVRIPALLREKKLTVIARGSYLGYMYSPDDWKRR